MPNYIERCRLIRGGRRKTSSKRTRTQLHWTPLHRNVRHVPKTNTQGKRNTLQGKVPLPPMLVHNNESITVSLLNGCIATFQKKALINKKNAAFSSILYNIPETVFSLPLLL